MKKLLSVILAVAIISVVVNGVLGYKLNEKKEDYAKLYHTYYHEVTTNVDYDMTVNKQGFMAIKDNDNFDDKYTVIASVTGYEINKDGTISDEYIFTTNLYDKEDKIVIEKENFEIGDIVTISFDGEDVVKVEQLTLATK